MNQYTFQGYKNREDYLKYLADTNGVPLEAVTLLAEVLGEDEDFDALATETEDLGWLLQSEISHKRILAP